MRRLLLPALTVALVLGIPMLVLQRWVAETRFAAIVLVLAWFAVVGLAIAVYVLRRGDRRLVVGATYARGHPRRHARDRLLDRVPRHGRRRGRRDGRGATGAGRARPRP